MERTSVISVVFLLLLATNPLELRNPDSAHLQSSSSSSSSTAPGVPWNLQVPFATNSSVRLSWQPPHSNGGSPVTNYTIYRGTSLGTESLFKVLGNVNSFVDTALVSRASYFYEVSASNAVGEGRRSYEVGARVGVTLTLTIAATYLDTGPLLSSISSQSPRSSLSSVLVSVWTNLLNESSTLNLNGLPAGTRVYPYVFPYTNRGSFSFNLALASDASANPGSYPLALSAQGPLGDNESIPLILNVRSFGVLPAPISLYLGQNETTVGAICSNPTPDTWANVSVSLVYQRPDGSQLAHNSVVSVSSANMCAGSPVLDRFPPNQTGTWYVRGTVNLESWDGSTEFMTTQSFTQPNFPPSFSVSFTVSTPPPKSLSVSLSANPVSVQSGGTSLLTATATANDGSKPIVTYTWSTSGGTLNSTSGNPVSWTAPAVQTTTALVIGVTAAASGYTQASTSISVFVVPNQPLTATLGENSTAGMAPFAVQFTGGASGGYPPYSFKWTFGDGGSSNSQSPSHVFLTPGNFTTTLTVTDSRLSSSSASVTVRALPRPPLALSVSATPLSGSAPLAVTFMSTVAGGTPPYSYAWSFGDGGSSTSAVLVYTYSAPGTYNATLAVTDGAEATARASVQVVANVPTYTITVSESGLPGGTSWAFTFGGRSYSSSNGSMSVGAVGPGSYQWATEEVDTCQGCRYTSSPASGTLVVPGSLTIALSFQAEYLVTLAVSPSGAGAVTPVSNGWYPAGASVMISARPSGTFVFNRWLSNQTVAVTGASVNSGAATATATVNGPGAIVAQFVDAWRGSYVKAYFGNQTWRPKIIEIHISSADSNGSWSSVATTVVGVLQDGGPTVVGSVGPAGTLFGFVTASGGLVGSPNPDGSRDFTVIQIAGNAAYVYGGLSSANRMSASPFGGVPIWVGILSIPAPNTDKLVFGDSIIPYATAAKVGTPTAGAPGTIVSLVGAQGGLFFTVQDVQGRTTGLDARSNASIAKIPGSYLVKIGGALAVVLPANVTSFTYAIDATRASQSSGNYTVALDSVGASSFSAQAAVGGSIKKGSTATYGTTIASNVISSAQLYAVTLSTMDPLGLPDPSATATLTSAGGVSATLSQGRTAMLPGGTYSLAMGTGSQGIHQTVNITHDGPVSVKVPLSAYSVALLAGIAGLIAGALFKIRKRLPRLRKPQAKVSEWLK